LHEISVVENIEIPAHIQSVAMFLSLPKAVDAFAKVLGKKGWDITILKGSNTLKQPDVPYDEAVFKRPVEAVKNRKQVPFGVFCAIGASFANP
jgi:hypothetical protein